MLTVSFSLSSRMPWQGDTSNMIDRFDARAHLDHIPEISVVDTVTKKVTIDREEHKCNYERYRTLVQNECAGSKLQIVSVIEHLCCTDGV